MLNLEYKQKQLPTGNIWNVALCNIDFNSPGFAKAKQQATLKSQYTMAASQAGTYRSPEFKFNMQLMGIIGEMAVEKFLNDLINENNLSNSYTVVRYDDVRTDGFRNAANEYDIRIVHKNNTSYYSVESRSSMLHDRDLVNGLATCNIIGPYSSVAKSGENLNDFYFLPLYEYLDYSKGDYKPTSFETFLKSGRIKLNLVGGCNKDFMVNNSRIGNLKQGATNFRLVQILSANDILSYKELIKTALMK